MTAKMRTMNNARKRVVCFGEVLLRLSPPKRELLLQTPQLAVHYGGAEANVAMSLASLGHAASVVTTLPDSALGLAARDELRRYGVETRSVEFAAGRMGLYFLTPGSGWRASEVLYDRQGSAFAIAPSTQNLKRELEDAAWFHTSGVTPALGPVASQAAIDAAKQARAQGVAVSFDGNYRSKLWDVWRGDGPRILNDIFEHVDLLFGDERDIGLVLGRVFEGELRTRREAAAQAAFAAFPNLRLIAATVRVEHDVDHHDLSAMLFSRDALWTTPSYPLRQITDRIGGGDAFAAGLLHGLLTGMEHESALSFALAASCLKHSVTGDFSPLRVDDIEAVVSGDGFGVRR